MRIGLHTSILGSLDLFPLVIHINYFINLASCSEALRA